MDVDVVIADQPTLNSMDSSGIEPDEPAVSQSQSPMKFDKELFDAEDSSDDEHFFERSGSPEKDKLGDRHDSGDKAEESEDGRRTEQNGDLSEKEECEPGEDRPDSGEDGEEQENDGGSENDDLEEEALDPELLKKLQKMKGAAKKPREQKARKCKPTKDDMLELHSETQRLLRESHVQLPYHKPERKSLQDFMERARKKQEVYRTLKGVRDIEKAQVIQEKIAEPAPVRLPKLRRPKRHSRRHSSRQASHSQQSEALSSSQTSLPDSGNVSLSDGNMDIGKQNDVQTDTQVTHSCSDLPEESDDELPNLRRDPVSDEGDSRSPATSGEAHQVQDSQDSQDSTDAKQNDAPQPIPSNSSEGCSQPQSLSSNSQVVEEFESQSTNKASQEIEEIESFPANNLLDDNEETVPESLEMEDGAKASETYEATDLSEQVSEATKQSSDRLNIDDEQSCRQQAESNSTPAKESDKSSGQANAHHEEESNQAKLEDSGASKGNSSSSHTKRNLKLDWIPEVVPKLGKGHGDFIILDEGEQEHNPKAEGVQKLMQRLLQQNKSKKKAKPAPSQVQISIVEKEGEEGAQELKLKTVTYQMDQEETPALEIPSNVPGGRLQALKQKLEVGMRQRRAAAYARRQQQFQLENEEGFDGDSDVDDGLPKEGEEEEMSLSETDDEEEEEEEDIDAEADADAEDEEREENPFLDKEADESDDESWHGDNEDEDADNSDGGDGSDNDGDGEEEAEEAQFAADDDELHLRLESSDDEETTVVSRKHSGRVRQLAISDDEAEEEDTRVEESLQPAQATTKSPPTTPNISDSKTKPADLSYESDGLTPMTRYLRGTQPYRSRFGSATEGSQDLYAGSESDHNNSAASQTQGGSVFDEMSQLLDADGYFKVSTLRSKPTREPLKIQDSQAGEEDMDDILGLCSGQFLESSPKGEKTGGFKSLFDGDSQSQDDRESLSSLFGGGSTQGLQGLDKGGEDGASQSSIGELIGLCSGQFPSSNASQQSQQSQAKRGVKRRLDVHDSEEEEEGTGPFRILSDDEGSKDGEQNEFSDAEEANKDGGSDDETRESKASFKGFKQGGRILKDFVEDEAELSGSEAESDENLDIAEEDDYLELEEGDNDVPMDDDQLRDQVGRVHMKQIMDDDDRELMRYKEMYLPDGDLHSEGSGRLRRFHWKDMDEGSQKDLFADGSDEEKEVEDADEKQWRMERFEREKFLKESQEQEEVEENSQLLQFGKFFMKRQVSDPSGGTAEKRPEPKPQVRSQSLTVTTGASPAKFVKPKVPKRGSFLNRSKESLKKIAEINKPASLNVNGTRGSSGFVFKVLSDKSENTAAEDKPAEEPAKPAPKKVAVHKQPAKKICVEPRPARPQKSIFKLLE